MIPNEVIVEEFPQLYSLSSKDKVKQWQIQVIQRDDEYFTRTLHGYIGQKITPNVSSAIKGKNIGKSNETTPLKQALDEAASDHLKKLDKNYSEMIPQSTDDFVNLLPMLAHKWKEKKHNIVYPAYVQPKFNGVRTLFDKDKFSSRTNKPFNSLGHLIKELEMYFPDFPHVLDGELFTLDLSFEDIVSAVKKEKEITQKLEFWIYDIADTKLTFDERLRILEGMSARLTNTGSKIKISPTYPVQNEDEITRLHAVFSREHEGTMVRNGAGLYRYDYRSTDLQKIKDFIDEEFTIIGGKSGSGADEGTVIFRCVTKDGKEFDVRPRGTRERRRDMYNRLAEIIGQPLTVRYQNYSSDGVPIFPVGIEIRDYE